MLKLTTEPATFCLYSWRPKYQDDIPPPNNEPNDTATAVFQVYQSKSKGNQISNSKPITIRIDLVGIAVIT